VVDDSIVGVENIKRHLSYGEAKLEAIITAVKEVGGAIAASTVCTVAVFAPIGFVGGMVGELFRPFGLTIAIALGASLLVSLTIVPVLSYWFVKSPVSLDQADLERQREQAEAHERRGVWQRAYLPTLRAALKHPVITLVVAAGLLGGTVAMIPLMKTDFLGGMGQDTLTVTQSFEMGTSLEVQDAEARPVEQALMDMGEVSSVQTTIGAGGFLGIPLGSTPEATYAVTLTDQANASAGLEAVRSTLEGLGGERTTGISVAGNEAMMGSASIDLHVTASDRESLVEAAALVTSRMAEVDGAVEVANNLTQDAQAVQVTVDRYKAAALGMNETQVMGLAASLLYPSQIGTLRTGEAAVPVRLALATPVESVQAVANLPLMATPAGVLTLGDLADVEISPAPASLTRVNGERSATVSVTPRPGDLGQISSRLTAALKEMELPTGVHVKVGGVAAQQSQAFSDLGLALLLAIAIVFIVMVAMFGSLIQPFLLLIAIPFAATGALIALLVTGTPLGVASIIGLLLLVGIVISNAIVLIDLINQYRRRGRDLEQAIEEGARKRLRPIVMTAAATILALTPMALGITGGGGSFISQPLAVVVIGGLVSSTLLTLVVVPVLYRFEARAHDKRLAKRSERLEQRRAMRKAGLASQAG
ncbi:MAG: efflux RND transporter permease subunit, partial [Micrococcales bacterium]|nr:efflux RND transporter permease subunit [Micrococcales bacterium]